MSFNFDPNVNLSNVQASHKSTDGGGGNTGYFQRRSSEGDDEQPILSFKKEDEYDSFSLSDIEDEEDKKEGFIDLILNLIGNLFKKIKNIFNVK